MVEKECDGLNFEIPPDSYYPHPKKQDFYITKNVTWRRDGFLLCHLMFDERTSEEIVDQGSVAIGHYIGITLFPGILAQGLKVIQEKVSDIITNPGKLLDEDDNLWIWISQYMRDWFVQWRGVLWWWEMFPPLWGWARSEWQRAFDTIGFLQLGGKVGIDNIGKGSICI